MIFSAFLAFLAWWDALKNVFPPAYKVKNVMKIALYKDRKQKKHKVTISVCKLSYWSPPYVDGKMVADTHLLDSWLVIE